MPGALFYGSHKNRGGSTYGTAEEINPASP
jgi:hypothetical protein